MKFSFLSILLALLFSIEILGQNIGISENGNTPDPSAILDLNSRSKGLLLPRLTTTERDLISSPAEGLMIYNIQSRCLNFYNGSEWKDACMDLNCYPQPSPAFAGNDTIVRNLSIQLKADAPYEGTGEWSIYSGGSGIFSNAADPQATFTVLTEGKYELRWTVTTPCGYRTDIVNVTLLEPCPSTVTDIDGSIYGVVQIGTQCWTTSNLTTTRYSDGEVIENITNNTAWVNTTNGAWCYNQNNPANNAIYGKLYNFFAVDRGNLCPTGWKVPNQNEFDLFLSNFDVTIAYSPELKSSVNWNGNNATGLNLIPGGYRHNGGFNFLGTEFYIWVHKQYSNTVAYYYRLQLNSGGLYLTTITKDYGMSCRCIKIQ